MKLIYISSSRIPSLTANSIHVMKMCQALGRMSLKVTLLAPDKCLLPSEEIKDVFSYYGVEKNFKIVKLPWYPIKGRAYIYGYIAAKYSQKVNADLVLSRNIFGAYFALKRKIVTALEMHQSYEDGTVIARYLLREVLNHDDLSKLILITNSLASYFSSEVPHISEKILIAPDAADPLSENYKQINSIKINTRFKVGYVGHLYKGKGMEIISMLAPMCPWADFHVVGGTKKENSYWSNRLSDLPNLIFHGHIPHKEVSSYIQAFDVVLLPNQSIIASSGGKSNISKWTSPLKLFEYMAAGKAIIASNLPVLKEVIQHGRNALLCSPTEPEEWKKALELLKNQPELRKSLGKCAQELFLEKFTWDKRAELLVNELLADRD